METLIELGGVQLSATVIIMLIGWFLTEMGCNKKLVPLFNIFTGVALCMLFTQFTGAEAVVLGIVNGILATGAFSGGKNTFEGIKEMLD